MSPPKSSRIGRAGQYRTEVFVPALGSALGLADLRLVLDLLRVYYPAIQAAALPCQQDSRRASERSNVVSEGGAHGKCRVFFCHG